MRGFGAALARRFLVHLSAPGVVLGAAAFVAALTPSLIPRAGLLQGGVAGVAFVTGYGCGVGAGLVWNWLGLWLPHEKRRWSWRRAAYFAAALLFAVGLFFASQWQQSIHDALNLPPVETIRPFTLGLVSIAAIVTSIVAGRFFLLVKDAYSAGFDRLLPPRVSFLLAAVLAAWTFWAVGNGVLLSSALRALDSAYREIDAFLPPDGVAPSDSFKTGSAASLVPWSSLGAEGRQRILSVPDRDQIAALSGQPALEPLRVYVGANSAETAEARASLAMAELIRIGGFERSLLVIATPTGTGWVDPAAMAPLEILHHGDVASVSVQYSYLPSWLSLLVEPQYGEETAAAVFRAVYGHWRSLPKTQRPRLYLFGLSLGALNSDLASDAFDIIGDPYDGAFWVGPPFASRTWRKATVSRDAGSPWWLPAPRNRSVFRFMSNADLTQLQASGWGSTRILYLQYPSDPIVFFERDSWRRQPTWLQQPRAPDVPQRLAWVPVVTSVQLVFDMMTATTVPKGVGHVYAASHYLEGWAALTAPEGWSDEGLQSLKGWLDAQGL